jgi:hypothetical protein
MKIVRRYDCFPAHLKSYRIHSRQLILGPLKMSLLENLLGSIATQGASLTKALGSDQGHLFEPKPWNTYDNELPSRPAWEASQKIIADCEALIALLTPTKIKLVTECVANNSTIGLGVAAHFKIADKIIENGGEASLCHLAATCQTDEHKLGNFTI